MPTRVSLLVRNAAEPCRWVLEKNCMSVLQTNMRRSILTRLCASCVTDPLVHHGRHFGRTVHALCNIRLLLSNGVPRLRELADKPEEQPTGQMYVALITSICSALAHSGFTSNREQREDRVFKLLIQIIPGIEDRLVEGADEDVVHIAELVRIGAMTLHPSTDVTLE